MAFQDYGNYSFDNPGIPNTTHTCRLSDLKFLLKCDAHTPNVYHRLYPDCNIPHSSTDVLPPTVYQLHITYIAFPDFLILSNPHTYVCSCCVCMHRYNNFIIIISGPRQRTPNISTKVDCTWHPSLIKKSICIHMLLRGFQVSSISGNFTSPLEPAHL